MQSRIERAPELGSQGAGKQPEKRKPPKVVRGGCKRSFGLWVEQKSPKRLLHHPGEKVVCSSQTHSFETRSDAERAQKSAKESPCEPETRNPETPKVHFKVPKKPFRPQKPMKMLQKCAFLIDFGGHFSWGSTMAFFGL